VRTLYMLHIPKTGGLGIRTISDILFKHGIPTYPSPFQFQGFDQHAYLHGHFGTLPIDQNPDIDVACLVREPFDRVVSSFIWLMMQGELQKYEPYASSADMGQLLRYYLFEETQYPVNNLMTRFLSNGTDPTIFRLMYVSPFWEDGTDIPLKRADVSKDYYKSWYLTDNTSLSKAYDTLDRVNLLGTTENHADFTSRVMTWFRDNYNLDIETDFKAALADKAGGNPFFNFGFYTDAGGTVWTTEGLKALLTDAERARVYDLNSLDVDVYRYALEKVNTPAV